MESLRTELMHSYVLGGTRLGFNYLRFRGSSEAPPAEDILAGDASEIPIDHNGTAAVLARR